MKELLEDEQIRDIRSKDDRRTHDRGDKRNPWRGARRAGDAGTDRKGAEKRAKVTEVIGDMAYVSGDNLEACGEEI